MALTHRGPFILIFALDGQLSTLLSRAMDGAPLRPQEFALTSVLRLTGAIRPTALADIVGMRPTSLSNHLRRLIDSGHVRRRTDPADGRAALINLTAKGVRDTEACFPAFGAAIATFRRHLADSDWMSALHSTCWSRSAARWQPPRPSWLGADDVEEER